MPAEAIRYVNDVATFLYGGNVDGIHITCVCCDAAYHIHYSNSEVNRISDCRTLAASRINAEHPNHERSILL
jgi:hypothetical protein